MNYSGHRLISVSEEHIDELYRWTIEDGQLEQYTCRPLSLPASGDEYAVRFRMRLRSTGAYFVMVTETLEPVGKIELFDYNPRNHSAEFGYYLPKCNRGKGLGGVMVSLFMHKVFADRIYDLNKLYATTSSNNIPSVKLLEKHGFTLDGRMREHYWIDGQRYDQLVYSILRAEWIRIAPSGRADSLG